MSSQPFFIQKHQRKLVQPLPLPWAKVSLTQEACKEFLAQWQSKKEHFKQDLDNTWQQIDNAMKTIALANHKSVNHASEEYKSLSMEEKKAVIEEYACHKERKTFGLCATAKSKVNDITGTLKAVENELTSLQYHMGAETVLYMTHGSTDLPLRGVAFTTEGIENFMGTVMHIDNQDLVLLQIINSVFPKCKVQSERSSTLSYIEEITGQPNAKMQWAHYFCNIVVHYLCAPGLGDASQEVGGWKYFLEAT
ncbi:hypothetical protein BKA83DRAFT_4132415 [Pisolithus microcarpus]|nr:hypothetical protein BKA83DRAFT_4132415 [Pisolithus microcarpus]